MEREEKAREEQSEEKLSGEVCDRKDLEAAGRSQSDPFGSWIPCCHPPAPHSIWNTGVAFFEAGDGFPTSEPNLNSCWGVSTQTTHGFWPLIHQISPSSIPCSYCLALGISWHLALRISPGGKGKGQLISKEGGTTSPGNKACLSEQQDQL